MNYKEYNDNELLSYISDNNEEAYNLLFQKYKPLIIKIAKEMIRTAKLGGLELDDLISEGMIGLSNAINNFDSNKEILFYTYARTLIERNMMTLITTSRRGKHKVLNESLSYEIKDELGNINEINSILKDDTSDPEKLIINIETEKDIVKKLKKVLTDFELQVFELRSSGFEYKEIAEILEKDYKQIDNAIQRIKTKIKKMSEV